MPISPLKFSVFRWGLPFLGLFLLLRLLFWGVTFPNPDEAYYWLWGQHPGFSYYDHPPFHAWVQGLFAAILGRSKVVLRLPNLISNGLLLVTYFHICRYLYRDRTADAFWLVVLLLVSSPLFFLFLALAWHDHWLVTFSVLSSYAFVRFLDSYLRDGRGHGQWLYGAAVFLGLAGLCKYNAVFVGLSFGVTLVVNRKLRSLLLDPRLYGAAATTLLTLAPILIWNGQHDFVSFQFYAARTAQQPQFHINPFQPVFFWLLCGLILGPLHTWSIGQWIVRWNQRQKASKATEVGQSSSVYGVVALTMFAVSTGSFTLLSLVAPASYYWNILAYPLLLPVLAGLFLPSLGKLSAPEAHAPFHRLRFLTSLLLVGLVAVATLIFHYTVFPLTALSGEMTDGDSAALFGWDAIASQVTSQAATLTNPVLLTTDYRSASALAYQLNNREVKAISGRRDQFDFWYDAAAMQGREAVLLGENWHPICPAHLAMFERTDPPQQIQVKRFGIALQTYTLIRGYGFKSGDHDLYPLQPEYPLAFTSDGEICTPK